MPHSLRARLSWLRYKRIISDKDYCRLCKALDNEKIIDKIRAEIEEEMNFCATTSIYTRSAFQTSLNIIDKYKAESEDT